MTKNIGPTILWLGVQYPLKYPGFWKTNKQNKNNQTDIQTKTDNN